MLQRPGARGRAWLLGAGVALAAAVALASTGVLAAGADPSPQPLLRAGGQGSGGYGWQALMGLTDEQVRQIGEIRRQAADELQPLQRQLFERRQELAAQLREDSPDPAKVESLVREIARIRGEMSAVQARTQLRIRGVLTEEQRARLRAWGLPGAGFGPGAGWCPGASHHRGRGFWGGGPGPMRGHGMGMMGPGWGY